MLGFARICMLRSNDIIDVAASGTSKSPKVEQQPLTTASRIKPEKSAAMIKRKRSTQDSSRSSPDVSSLKIPTTQKREGCSQEEEQRGVDKSEEKTSHHRQE